MKILFTSVGRRVELVQEFKNAAKNLNIDLNIIGADYSDTAPALFFCDSSLKVCKINDENYIPMLIYYCKKEKVDLLIPTIDTDLLILSKYKYKFKDIGTQVFISSEDKIKICRDKRETALFFDSVGLKTPIPIDDYKKYDLGFPAFIKPKDGSSSINAFKVNDESELETYSKEVPDYIIAPFIEGTEYTIDAFCDIDGSPIFITPRIRLAVRSGEVLKTQIVQDDKIINEAKKIIENFKPCGPITIQLIRQTTTGDDYYIEINPRFGGGAPLSMKAGANSAEATLKMLAGERLHFVHDAAEDGAVYSRFDQSVRVK
ncbi:MAG: ATP-grasp domain-containing protein [Acholeplasmatales bacterium]|nr:ATP-grasp domain-containing protein [Acholeplasmatales bacterium]